MGNKEAFYDGGSSGNKWPWIFGIALLLFAATGFDFGWFDGLLSSGGQGQGDTRTTSLQQQPQTELVAEMPIDSSPNTSSLGTTGSDEIGVYVGGSTDKVIIADNLTLSEATAPVESPPVTLSACHVTAGASHLPVYRVDSSTSPAFNWFSGIGLSLVAVDSDNGGTYGLVEDPKGREASSWGLLSNMVIDPSNCDVNALRKEPMEFRP